MPKFKIACIERWEHKVYYEFSADSLEQAIADIRSGEAAPDDHSIAEIVGDALRCVDEIEVDGEPIDVPPELSEEPADPPALTPNELATVLAALRLWQRTDVTDPELLAIAAEGRDDVLCGLAVEEIDVLCERLNGRTAQPPDSVGINAVQSLAELIEICRWKCSPHDEVILASGRTNHQALLDAVKAHTELTE